ncbi:glycosyltransferase [Candidatus Alkanophaga liquidiphilum]
MAVVAGAPPMHTVKIVVPVAASEPVGIIERSIEALCRLKCHLPVEIIYVIDSKDDERYAVLKELVRRKEKDVKISLLFRGTDRGRRAGALNDALAVALDENSFFAFFDIDSRPNENFLEACLEVLEADESCEIAFVSAPRYIINEGVIPRLVSAEYELLTSLYKFFGNKSVFLHFNGLIGVARASIFSKWRFDETKICEDVDMSDKIYLSGWRVATTLKTRVGEQAPQTLADLYFQRIRWMLGPLECLSTHFTAFLKAKIPRGAHMACADALPIPYDFHHAPHPRTLLMPRRNIKELQRRPHTLLGRPVLANIHGVLQPFFSHTLRNRQENMAKYEKGFCLTLLHKTSFQTRKFNINSLFKLIERMRRKEMSGDGT